MKHSRDWITDVGILVVGLAAAILTFTTLRALAEACGITGWLAWLVPVTVDAAAIIAARVWLRGEADRTAVEFARTLAWVCIAESILGNAGQHYMAAFHVAPPWWVVVLVSAVPPATLGAVVHLGHLRTGGPDRRTGSPDRGPADRVTPVQEETVVAAAPVQLDEDGPGEWTDPWDRWAEPDERTALDVVTGPTGPGPDQDRTAGPDRTDPLLPQVVRWAADRTGPVSQRAVRSEFGVGAGRAAKLVDQLEAAR